MKTHFTRKNYIFIAISYFYILMALFAGLALDASNPVMKSNNPIQKIANAFGFPLINPGFAGYVLLACILIYLLLFISSIIYEVRLAKYYEDRVFSKKWVITYVLTFFISFGLCFGIGMVAQYPYKSEYMINSLLYMLESLFIGLLLFIFLGSIIFSICLIFVNFKHIDEPFRFFGSRTKELEDKEKEQEEKELKDLDDQGNLAASFGESNVDSNGNPINGVGTGTGVGNASGVGANSNFDELNKEKEKIFPGLCSIDLINESYREKDYVDDNIQLDELCNKFRLYLAKVEKLYFDINTIRAFISGLASSRLIILEGLSGTGKSSLARYFSEFISQESFFEAVQATWRDRTNLLGYYNDFSKTYNETEFLKRLYDATFKPNEVNIMVLDEVNISRVEYYFADFLSIMEYPSDKWALKIMNLPYDFIAPNHLEDGILHIPTNTWFIGTANKDDSTYTITDKVYDRAITINFDDRNEPFEVKEDVNKIAISFNHLMDLFNEAINKEENKLTKEELEKFNIITNYVYDTFDLTFGNRIMHQIEMLVPTYFACGGSKLDALDFMFSRKVISKLEGRFEDYIKSGLINLKKLIIKTYGENEFKLTNHAIDKLLKKL